ncbi:hypothetical protein Q9X98_005089 [Vibrio parahaemolyticus]|nr:hypothetical protein [Vibrio parahaemolyticus]ELA7323435.1 hypothetical protein [Vibrio parahaemolyticus]
MVNVAFIVEGNSEKIIVESDGFRSFLRSLGYELISPVVDAQGGGNLLPNNIEVFLDRLRGQDPEHIFILTDLEDEPSVDEVRSRVGNDDISFSFVAIKALEAWYLADTDAIRSWLKCDVFYEEQPEKTVYKPWDRLKEIAMERGKPGPGSKVTFAKKIIKKHGFDIKNAAAHEHCESAKELVEYFEERSTT